MEEIFEELRGSVLAAILVGVFLIFLVTLFSGNGEMKEVIEKFLIAIGGGNI